MNTNIPIKTLVESICKPRMLKGKRVRALNPWSSDYFNLLQNINKGQFILNGFRNKDIRNYLYSENIRTDEKLKKKLSSAITRKIRLLRAHGIVKKINKTHRYVLTKRGCGIITAILQYQNLSLDQIEKIAA